MSVDLPWYATTLHVIGESDIITPDIVLPLAKSNHATQDVAGVNANPHVNVETGGSPHSSDTIIETKWSLDLHLQ